MHDTVTVLVLQHVPNGWMEDPCSLAEAFLGTRTQKDFPLCTIADKTNPRVA